MKTIITLFIFSLAINSVFADSPLTSTVFYKAYMDIPIVQKASNAKGSLSGEELEYLYNNINPLDVKLALINAKSWDHAGISNSQSFLMYVMKNKKYKTELGDDLLAFKLLATSNEQICYAYLRAFDNYFDVIYACEIAEEARKKKPNSFAVNMIYNLIKAQGLTLLGESCYADKIFSFFKTNPSIILDVKPEAQKYIFEYMDTYSDSCR